MRIWKSKAACLIALSVLISGCGGPGDTEMSDSGERKFLSIGTAPPGGAFFVVGGALAQVLDEYSEQGWQVTAEATKGTQENIRRLSRGELDFALANAAISHFAVRGEGGWEQAHDVRAVMTLAPNVALFVAPKSNGIESLADLKGKRVVLGPAGAGFEYFLRPILAAHGVDWQELEGLYGTQTATVDMLADGVADAAFLGGAVPTASLTQASTSMDLKFIPFDQEAVDGLLEEYPFFARATIPGGTYRGQDDDFAGMNVGSMHFITSAATDEDLVYTVTATLWEHRERVVEKHAAGRAIQAAVIVRDTGTPFHPGAERFYRDSGLWPE